MPKQMTEDELARAAKISQLYPQPSADKNSFTHFTPEASRTETPKSKPINWFKLVIAGIAIALPFIIFDMGISALSSTTSTTEAGQLGMLSTIYLLFTAIIAWLTYKHFIKISPITSISSSTSYWMILLFSIPTALLLKGLVFANSPAATANNMLGYYLVVCTIFTTATAAITFLVQRQNRNESDGLRLVSIFLALPYAVGLLVALIKIFRG